MSIVGTSIKWVSLGFAAGFLAKTGPNLGPDVWQFGALLAFSAAILLLFEFSNLEPNERRSGRVRERAHGKWERGLNRE